MAKPKLISKNSQILNGWRKFGNRNRIVQTNDLNMPDVVSESQRRIKRDGEQRKKLRRRADIKVFNLQRALFDAGYFGNTRFQDAVDGFMGQKTKAAMREAHKAGFRFNEAKGGMEKIPIQRFKQTQGTSLYADTYMNLFPYSYGSFVEENGKWVPYDASKHGDITNRKFKIAGGHEEPADLLSAVTLNFKNVANGKDPRRAIFDQLCDMDLSKPENKQKFMELAKKAHIPLYNKQDAELSQKVIRARQDAMYMHAYGKQKYNTFMINPSYESRTAVSKRKPTYTYRDPSLRNTINGDLYNSWKSYGTNFTLDDGTLDDEFKSSRPTYTKLKNGKSVYRVPIMSSMGNIMLIADDDKGTNMRYYDKWDYLTDDYGVDPSSNEFYYGDNLTIGDTPIYTTPSHGYNRRGYAETPSGLIGKAANQKKEELWSNASNLISKAEQKINSYIKRFT